MAPALVANKQVRRLQHIEMLADGRQRHVEGRGNCTDAHFTLPRQACKNCPARGIGQGRKGLVELLRHYLTNMLNDDVRQAKKSLSQVLPHLGAVFG